MPPVTFEESGLVFGPFDDDVVWRVDGSPLHRSLGDGVKMADFILWRDGRVWIVEAKSSSPHPENAQGLEDYYAGVTAQLRNAFDLLVASRLDRHRDHAPPGEFARMDLATVEFLFVIVITNQ